MKKIFWTLLGTLLLIGAALYNQFPLVTSDSGTYILSGFKFFIPADRPIVYGLFVRHSSLAVSLWFTIIFQSLILSYLLWLTLNEFANSYVGRTGKFFIITFLVLFTGISWYSSQIMPDVFTCIGILAFALLLLSESSLGKIVLLSVFFVGAALMHNSNSVIFSLLLILVLPFAITTKLFQNKIIKTRRFVLVLILIISAWLLAPTINYSIKGEFKTAGNPHAFLMAKFIENGAVDHYLNDVCDSSLITSIPDSGLYLISPKHSEKFIDVEGFSKANGAIIHQWDYLGTENQQFYIIKVSKGYYKIISKNSNKCIEVSEKDTTSLGAPLIQNDYKGKDNQLFSFRNIDNKDCWFIENKKSKKLLDISGISNDNGAAVNQWNFTGAENQQFRIVRYPYCLCLYKDKLPNSAVAFLWENNGVFAKTGAWAWSENEYKKVLSDLMFSPKYIGITIGDALVSTLQQLTQIDIGSGLGGYDKNSSPYVAIANCLKYELKPFSNSKENRWALNFTEINNRNFWIIVFSMIIIICFFKIPLLRKSILQPFIVFIYISFSAIVCNAFVTGALANVLDRLQCRVVWFIPMIALILLCNYFIPVIKKHRFFNE